jgi:hypothetical protein
MFLVLMCLPDFVFNFSLSAKKCKYNAHAFIITKGLCHKLCYIANLSLYVEWTISAPDFK